ncbi:uncharacterized protein LTHEOB_12812 [Neofusicoccum parvum]|uniref:Uncharacterized protein LTHEOB_12812 n=1 Tax=Neofusicoccum parvum TaxID=310453 RepID=A0ACB5S9X8_9PEZI|nr:uncharacterized protein LTHEOB_12812 [Neofusicoccum parvum]
MFDLPDAKRIRRTDLASTSPSPTSTPRSSPDPSLTAHVLARLNKTLDITLPPAAPPAPPTPNDDPAASSDNELEFRLFAAPAPDAAPNSRPAVQKIRLHSPSADDNGNGPGGFVVAARPAAHYFAHALEDGENGKAAEYVDAAVSGAEVVARAAGARWAGCGVPWRVRVGEGCGRVEGDGIRGGREGRRRKGKKARMALRRKVRARVERKEEAERVAREREEAERAKRTARNREKKVKKKERERAKKASATAEEDDGGEKEDVVMGED